MASKTVFETTTTLDATNEESVRIIEDVGNAPLENTSDNEKGTKLSSTEAADAANVDEALEELKEALLKHPSQDNKPEMEHATVDNTVCHAFDDLPSEALTPQHDENSFVDVDAKDSKKDSVVDNSETEKSGSGTTLAADEPVDTTGKPIDTSKVQTTAEVDQDECAVVSNMGEEVPTSLHNSPDCSTLAAAVYDTPTYDTASSDKKRSSETKPIVDLQDELKEPCAETTLAKDAAVDGLSKAQKVSKETPEKCAITDTVDDKGLPSVSSRNSSTIVVPKTSPTDVFRKATKRDKISVSDTPTADVLSTAKKLGCFDSETEISDDLEQPSVKAALAADKFIDISCKAQNVTKETPDASAVTDTMDHKEQLGDDSSTIASAVVAKISTTDVFRKSAKESKPSVADDSPMHGSYCNDEKQGCSVDHESALEKETSDLSSYDYRKVEEKVDKDDSTKRDGNKQIEEKENKDDSNETADVTPSLMSGWGLPLPTIAVPSLSLFQKADEAAPTEHLADSVWTSWSIGSYLAGTSTQLQDASPASHEINTSSNRDDRNETLFSEVVKDESSASPSWASPTVAEEPTSPTSTFGVALTAANRKGKEVASPLFGGLLGSVPAVDENVVSDRLSYESESSAKNSEATTSPIPPSGASSVSKINSQDELPDLTVLSDINEESMSISSPPEEIKERGEDLTLHGKEQSGKKNSKFSETYEQWFASVQNNLSSIMKNVYEAVDNSLSLTRHPKYHARTVHKPSWLEKLHIFRKTENK